MSIEINQATLDAAFVSGCPEDFKDDALNIQFRLKVDLNLHVTLRQAYDIWEHYSASRCAQWLTFDVEDEGLDKKLTGAIKSFIESRLSQ